MKFLKKGNVRITKKKSDQKSISSKVVSAKPPAKNVQQVYYTDNQLLNTSLN